MSCADSGTGDTISGRRCPLCGPTLARWHKPQLGTVAGIGSDQKGFRADWLSQPKHAKKPVNGLFWPKGSDRNAHIKDAPTGNRKSSASSRTYRDSNPHAARTIRSIIVRVASVMSGFSSFRKGNEEVQPPTHICAFRSLPRGQKRSHRDLFCMFRVAEHSPRDAH
jgi:hypothetical protein